MVADFDDGQASGSAAAEAAGMEFVGTLADLAGYQPKRAIEVAETIIAEIRKVTDYAELRAGRGGATAGSDALIATLARVAGATESGGSDDTMGRNQKSRIREAVVLDIIERNAGPCPLQKIMTGLLARRISSSQAAVVSHLHRLKAMGLITQPGSGFYDIAPDGQAHLRKLKASLGPLVGA